MSIFEFVILLFELTTIAVFELSTLAFDTAEFVVFVVLVAVPGQPVRAKTASARAVLVKNIFFIVLFLLFSQINFNLPTEILLFSANQKTASVFDKATHFRKYYVPNRIRKTNASVARAVCPTLEL